MFSLGELAFEELAKLNFSKDGVRRICVHRSPDDNLHCMILEAKAGTSYVPHSHSDSAEITLLISGTLEILQWRESLENEPVLISLKKDGELMAYTPENMVNKTTVGETNAIYIEVKLGPFNKQALIKY